jgi:hypothetical protein
LRIDDLPRAASLKQAILRGQAWILVRWPSQRLRGLRPGDSLS